MKSRSTLTNIARRLRTDQTDTEQLMWSLLRAKRFDGFKFRRQHPMSGSILDFYCPQFKLNIELDGGQHFEPEAMEKDRRRDETLKVSGITVLRFEDRAFFKNRKGVMQKIYETLMELAERKSLAPLPDPLPEYGARGPEHGGSR
jgi:very-short-patch-repair endonuclease